MADKGLVFEEIAQERAAASETIVNSSAKRRLIVAGPGTGKTHTFKQALSKAIVDSGTAEKALALTFIRNLVADLAEALSDVADVFTFHGFCKHQMHRHAVAGLQEGWDYYPALIEVMAADLQLLGRKGISKDEIERCPHDLDDSDGVITDALKLGNYYNAVSHTDLVHALHRERGCHPELSTDRRRRVPGLLANGDELPPAPGDE